MFVVIEKYCTHNLVKMPRYEIFLKACKVFHKCFLGVLGLVIRSLTCLIPKWSQAQLSDSTRNKLHVFSKRKKGLKQFCFF